MDQNQPSINDEKLTMEKLWEQGEILRVLAANLPEIICLFAPSGRLVYANPSVERVLGEIPTEFPGPAHPGDADAAHSWFQQTLHGSKKPLCWRLRDRNGQWLWTEMEGTALDYNGTTHVLTVCRDITERKRVEETVKASEERLRLSFEAAQIGTGEMNLETEQISLSDPMRRVVGLPPGTANLSFDEWLELIHPEDRKSVRREVENSIAGQPTIALDYRVVWPDGSEHWVTSRARTLFDDAGKATRIIGAIMDITERKQVEDEARMQKEQLQRIFDNAPLAISFFDEKGCLLVNRAWERMFGWKLKELLELNLDVDAEIFPDLQERQRALNLRAAGTNQWEEFKARTKEGRVIDVSISAVHLSDGTTIGLLQDITERKRTEEKIRNQQEALRIVEEQFHHAQKMEAIGRLAGGVSHDFNNELTVIGGYCHEILISLRPEDPIWDMVLEIQKAEERAAALTRQLLMFSRQQVIEPKVLDLNTIVINLEKMLRRLIGEDILLAVVPGPALAPIRADRGQLEQVLINLAVNARDAMPQGGRLTIETLNVTIENTSLAIRSKIQPGNYVMLTVSDTGIGMDERTRARIFEPFFTTKDTGKGTGLGLSVVHGVVVGSSGHIDVSSEPGKGTTFRIYFPANTADVPAGKSISGVSPVPGGNETVLLAEDQRSVRAMAHRILESYGYTVLEASDGQEAVQIAEKHAGPIHLLVTDVVMPHLGGRQLADRLMTVKPGLEVLFMSGYTDDGVLRHGVPHAEVAFLQKPFTPIELAQKVREALDKNKDRTVRMRELPGPVETTNRFA